MADETLQSDSLAGNEAKRAGGARGGAARTPEKLAAVRANIAKARITKEWYRRHPEQRPERRGQPTEE